MERDEQVSRWVGWGWLALGSCSLVLITLVWGGAYSQKLDYWGGWVRSCLNYPVRSHIKYITDSPDGKWELTCITREYTHLKESYLIAFQKDEIIARRNGKMFLGGRNLDPDYRFSVFQRYYKPKVSWPNNALAKFDDDRIVFSGFGDEGTTITLTVENRTDAEIPYVIARYCYQNFFFFEMPAHSRSRVSFAAPMPKVFFRYDPMGSRIGCMAWPSEKFVWEQQNYHSLRRETYESTITLQEGKEPVIQFKPVSEVKAP